MFKIAAYSIFSVLTVVLIAAVAFYVRLASGPVSLNFMTQTFQEQINRNLAGMTVAIDGALIERAAGSGVPHFRLSNIELKDRFGSLIARAPRAAIGIDESQLLSGRVVPVSLDLIGPRIRIKRNLEGGIELGFGESAASEDEVAVIDESDFAAPGKTHQQSTDAQTSSTFGATVIAMLSGDSSLPGNSMTSLETIRVSGAEIKFYDEANDAIWDAPRAELAFRRMPYGFAVAANAAIDNGAEAGQWKTEVSVSYRRDSQSFLVSARIEDLIPANISDEVFALSQLARFKVPLAGQAEAEVSADGVVTRASAEFAASAGQVGFPDYLAEPIVVDEGSLRADYDPVTGGIVITDSQLLAGGSRAQITGNVLPVRNEEGYLSAIKVSLNARNVALDTQGTVKSPVMVDRIDFVGTAAVNEAKLDIDDLVVMSGNTGVRLRGTITGGGESAGILLSGRIRDLSAGLLKRLWPPIMAPKTRNWVYANVSAGRVTEGEFQVNLPVDALSKAQKAKRLPPKSVRLSFRMKDVSSKYFKNLPPLLGASGEASLEDNEFNLRMKSAEIEVPSGKRGKITGGTMVAKDILATETLGEFQFAVDAPVQTVIEYISLPDLPLLTRAGFDVGKLSGGAKVDVSLSLPLAKTVPKERVKFQAKAKLSDTAIAGALPNIDITDGELALLVGGGKIEASGPAKINGVPVKLAWQRGPGPAAKQSAVIEAKLGNDARKKIGIDLGEFMRGTVAIKATLPDLADEQGRTDIEADLSDTEMQIAPISWSRAPAAKTTAVFTYFGKGEKGKRIEDLVIKGPGLLIKGAISLGEKNTLKEARLTDVRLSDENIFALTIGGGEETSIALKGDSFDARPLIKSMFGSQRNSGGDDDTANKKKPMSISVNVDRLHAHRGEILSGVTADIQTRGNKVEAAEINGTFLSGQPVVLRIVPVNGGREMRISGRDGGAAMRAANLYSKIAGGQIEFYALMANDNNSSVKRGQLVLRNFEVRNEAALAQLDSKGKPKKSGPRKGGLAFRKLVLPFTTDAKFVRLGDSKAGGDDICATAEGVIRKSDSALDVQGTIVPACAVNGVFNNIPLVGDILGGGKGEGIIGVTYSLGGNVNKPVVQINPASVLLPGFLRNFAEFGNAGEAPQPTSRNEDKINQ